MRVRTYTTGSEHEREGLTHYREVLDDDGNMISGWVGTRYKEKEISAEEFNRLEQQKCASVDLGFAGGILSEKGKSARKKYLDDVHKRRGDVRLEKAKRLLEALTSGDLAAISEFV